MFIVLFFLDKKYHSVGMSGVCIVWVLGFSFFVFRFAFCYFCVLGFAFLALGFGWTVDGRLCRLDQS